MNAPNDGDPVEHAFAEPHDPPAYDALGHEAANQDQDQCDQNAQTGDVNAKERVRMKLRGHDGQQTVHHADEEYEDIEGQADGDGNGQTRQKDAFQVEFQGLFFPLGPTSAGPINAISNPARQFNGDFDGVRDRDNLPAVPADKKRVRHENTLPWQRSITLSGKDRSVIVAPAAGPEDQPAFLMRFF
jgi:hypothetical protein